MAIEHVTLPVKNYKKSKEFYEKALWPLGYKLNMDFPEDSAGFKEGGHTSFWVAQKRDVAKIKIYEKRKKNKTRRI